MAFSPFKARLVYDPANDINEGGAGGDAALSYVMKKPVLLQTDVPAGTDIEVYARVSPSMDWLLITTLNGGATQQFYEFTTLVYNQVQLKRVTGVADFVVYSQR